MTDHHDFGDDHHFEDFPVHDFGHDEPQHYDDGDLIPDHFEHFDDPGHFDDAGHFAHETAEPHAETPVEEHHDTTAVDDPAPADVFPPPVDVGDLPEPVDGFPWTDAATLGSPDLAVHDLAGHDTVEPVDPHELAEYAGTEIPPGADPWAVLADSDDPATSTLARFWHQEGR
jgi:hypothetical protein